MSRRTSATGEEKVKPALRRSSSGGASKSSLEPTAPADVYMESILDKLKILDYESKFCKAKKPHRPLLHNLSFAVPSSDTNGGQFSYFVNLVVWLLGFFGKKIPPPKDFDDPTVVCTSLINEMKLIGFPPPSFSLTKLHKGYGDEVCGLLNGLLDTVLRKIDFKFLTPIYPQCEEGVDEEESDIDDDDDEIIFDEEESDSSCDENNLTIKQDPLLGHKNDNIFPLMNVEEWHSEIARVVPVLRKFQTGDTQDWRRHLKQARETYNSLTDVWNSLKKKLKIVSQDIAHTTTQVAAKETALNQKCWSAIEFHSQRMQELNKYRALLDDSVKETDDLAVQQKELDAECARISHQIETKSASLSDASPMVKVKNSVESLQSDVANMKLTIGILSNTLLQYSLRKNRDLDTVDEDDF